MAFRRRSFVRRGISRPRGWEWLGGVIGNIVIPAGASVVVPPASLAVVAAPDDVLTRVRGFFAVRMNSVAQHNVLMALGVFPLQSLTPAAIAANAVPTPEGANSVFDWLWYGHPTNATDLDLHFNVDAKAKRVIDSAEGVALVITNYNTVGSATARGFLRVLVRERGN